MKMNIKIVFPVLLLLIAANFAVFVVNVWYMLPSPDDASAVSNALEAKAGPAPNNHKERTPIVERGAPKTRIRHQAKPVPTMSTDPIRYDKISSLLKSSYGVVHQLPSIPPKRQMVHGTYGSYAIPSDAVTNLTYFLESRVREDEEERPLYLYNPSLLPLNPDKVDGSVIENLSTAQATYIATYRVSNFGNCHGPGRGVPDTYQNYLGIALLDKDLNIVQQDEEYYDVVIDLNAQLFNSKKKKIPQTLQDCQIYTAPSNPSTTTLDDLLLLQCNEYVMPITLKLANGIDDRQLSRDQVALHNTYGPLLQVTVLQRPHMICRNGKNMHHFGPGYIETWPGGPHEYIHVDFSSYPFVNSASMKAPKIEPEPSYKTPDGNLIDRDSGSACCVTINWIEDGRTRQLLLGFSHRKTRKAPKKDSYNYVSRIYAFETSPPFNIVARSGLFCLGFANHSLTDAEARLSDNEQLVGSANEHKLTIQNQVYDCPRIHFITGIAEKMNDEGTVIVAYGVNDCYPRMVEVKKEFLISLLKGEGLE